MPTERQAAANRTNAANSTGPRSTAGKRRASHNSFRHGLSSPVAFAKSDQDWIERFARAATKGSRTVLTLELAHSAARAHLDLLRIRQVRAETIDRMQIAFERSGSPAQSTVDPRAYWQGHKRADLELARLARYERRAASRRDRALRAIMAIKRAAARRGK